MARLDDLTPEQEASLRSWLDEAITYALSSAPADRAAAEQGVHMAYRAASLRPPRRVVWRESPYWGCLETADGSRTGSSATVRLVEADPGRIHARLRRLPRNQVRDRLRAQVGDRARGEARTLLGDPLLEKVGRRLGDAVGQQMLTQMPPEAKGRVERSVLGQHDHWLWYALGWEALGVDVTPIRGLAQVARNAGWWWPGEDTVVLTDRPEHVSLDDLGRLHNPSGPALRYRDGWSIYAWRGIRVPASLIETDWDFDAIMREPDQRIRRCAIDRLGWDRFVDDAGLRQVASTVPDPGNPGLFLSLYDLPYIIDDLNLRLLVCDNGTPEADGRRSRFGLTVPPDMPDPLTAMAWTFDLTPAEYAKLQRGA